VHTSLAHVHAFLGLFIAKTAYFGQKTNIFDQKTDFLTKVGVFWTQLCVPTPSKGLSMLVHGHIPPMHACARLFGTCSRLFGLIYGPNSMF
jgi:hypothetical protein